MPSTLVIFVGSNNKKRAANVGELERKYILECYNLAMGKSWSEVLGLVKERILEARLPEHIIQIYMDFPQKRVITRMKNIVKKAVSTPPPSTATTSKPIYVEEQAEVQDNLMVYAEKKTPAERKLQNKLRKTFVATSDSSEEEETQKRKKKKSDKEVAREAQEAHKELCSKAMDTLDKVNSLLASVDSQMKKKQ